MRSGQPLTNASGEPVTYAITDGNAAGQFAIDGDSGAVEVRLGHARRSACWRFRHVSWRRDAGRLDTRLRRPDTRVGAVASDVGTIRNWCRGSGQEALASGCCMRASTLIQGASHRPRGGGTMTVLSGFSKCSRRETWEEVPASGRTRRVEPQLPRGRRLWDKCRPAARAGRGVEP